MQNLKTYFVETKCWKFMILTDSNIDMLNLDIKRKIDQLLDMEKLSAFFTLSFDKRSEKIKRILNWNLEE